MNIFTANQVNQVYVLTEKGGVKTKLEDLKEVGDILVKGNKKDGQIYFQHKGAGGLTRSDLIDVKNIMWVRTTKAEDMAPKLKAVKIEVNEAALDGANPIVGEDYILRLEFQQVFGLAEDSKYLKFGAVHGYKGLSISDFYKTLALNLVKNMAREETQIVKVKVGETEVTKDMKVSDIAGTADSILIEEVEQDWILGIKQQRPITFLVVPSTVKDADGQEVVWGNITYSDGTVYTGGPLELAAYSKSEEGLPASTTLTNGKLMADYEFFYMGERADQYRRCCIDYVPTTYLVDPTKEYDTIGIHFAFTDSNESVQKSEKDITIISLKGKTAALITAINTAITNAGGTTTVPALA